MHEYTEATCKVCGVTIHKVVEPHWIGWLDEDDDQLSYVPTLHDHTADEMATTEREG